MAIQLMLCSFAYAQGIESQLGYSTTGYGDVKSISVKARAIDVITESIDFGEDDHEESIFNEIQTVTFEILTGDRKGETITVEN